MLFTVQGGPEFSVGTYHMPCIFWDTDVMNMHVALVVECLDDFAGTGRHALARPDANPNIAMQIEFTA